MKNTSMDLTDSFDNCVEKSDIGEYDTVKNLCGKLSRLNLDIRFMSKSNVFLDKSHSNDIEDYNSNNEVPATTY